MLLCIHLLILDSFALWSVTARVPVYSLPPIECLLPYFCRTPGLVPALVIALLLQSCLTIHSYS